MRHTTIASILTLSAVCTSQADLLPAIDWEPTPNQWHILSATTIGWSFTVSDEINVHQLGMYMSNGTLLDSHQIGLFDASGALLASTGLEAGHTGDSSTEHFVYNDVDPVALQPGQLYVLFVDNIQNDSSTLLNEHSSFGEHIQWNSIAWNTADSIFSPFDLHDPEYDDMNGQGQAMGASFQYTLAPAPGAIALLALAGCTRRRRRR